MVTVFDCNVLLDTTIFKRSDSRACFEKAKTAGPIIVSLHTFNEFKDVILRDKFDKYATREARLELILEIQELVHNIPVSHSVNICRDSKDNMYLELALSGKADCIITNDEDLLVLNPFENISIITPKEFLERYS